MEACSCGRLPGPSDNFCSGCGSSVSTRPAPVSTDSPLGVPLEGSGTDLLIEGTTAEKVHSDSVVQSPVNLRWLVMGGLALVLLLFGLTQWPKGESSSPETDAAAAEADEADSDDEASSDPNDPDSDDEPAEEADETASPSTTESDVEAGTSANAADEGSDEDGAAQAGGPLVGEPTGYGVIYGSQGFGRLKLLELDTGIVHELEATGEPIGIVGSSLVARRSNAIAVYPLSTVDANATLIAGSSGWVDVVALTDDRIWVVEGDPTPDGWTIVGYDQTGSEVEEAEQTANFPFFGWNLSIDFVQGEGGGIYRREGDTFRRVSVGVLLAVGERLALARECDERLNCGLNWYDKDDWDSPLDLPTPDLALQGTVTIESDDRWMVAANWVNGRTELYEVQTGEMVRTVQQTTGPLETSIGLSPDGRWLIDPGFGNTVMIDLDSGTEWPLDIRGELAMVVDLAVVGFAG